METITVRTREHSQLIDITREIQALVSESSMDAGIVNVFVPHTTAGITINESADPSVAHDILAVLDRLVPWRDPKYRHSEGNAAAHVKASLVGSSVRVIVSSGGLKLGTWQGIFFCEFDGPRTRKVHVALQPVDLG
ncbi:MAG: YjbQ family protein [Anaerolineaceae bacterium]|nr:MAG: YjbQ family protein [Anaerolineaceae bacterium]